MFEIRMDSGKYMDDDNKDMDKIYEGEMTDVDITSGPKCFLHIHKL